MILITTAGLLLLAFLLQLIWWRIKLPTHSTSALLFIFLSVLVMSTIYLWQTKAMNAPELARFILFYVSSTFVYIIFYSTIEQQSPTLAMIHYLHQQGHHGCTFEALNKSTNLDNEVEKRLAAIKHVDWIFYYQTGWRLTKKGQRIAFLFEYAAKIFGLKLGG